jgi:isoleucyl-tRNA synthetase
VTVDLSAFYLDVSKDRSIFHADSVERRSAQTASTRSRTASRRLLARVLSITADDLAVSPSTR